VSGLWADLETALAFGQRLGAVRAWPWAERRAAAWFLVFRQYWRAEACREKERKR